MTEVEVGQNLVLQIVDFVECDSPASTNCVVSFNSSTFKTKPGKWSATFDLGPNYKSDDQISIICKEKDKTIGAVKISVEEAKENKESKLRLMTESGEEAKGLLELKVLMLDPNSTEYKQLNKGKKGFFKKLCSFFIPTKNKSSQDCADSDESEDESESETDETEGTEETEESSPPSPRQTPASQSVNKEVVLQTTVGGKLFGRPLEEVIAAQAEKYPELKVPYFIYSAAKIIREEGLIETMGLFRVRGRLAEIKQLKAFLDNGNDITIENSKNIHNVTSLIKSFLRELPVPILTFGLYDKFLACHGYPDEEDTEKALIRCVRKLPENNLELLKFLLSLMHDISLKQEVNKMSGENLGRVLSPNLLWKEKVNIADLSQVVDMKKANELVELMIIKYPKLFGAGGYYVQNIPSDSEDDDDDDDDDDEKESEIGNIMEQMKKGNMRRMTNRNNNAGGGAYRNRMLNKMRQPK